jgi:small subunit ribosomal protein S4
MGDPKLSRRVWKKPKRPLNYDLMMDELKILGTFGLKTKRELWKANTELSRLRLQARSLLALRQEDREQKEPILINSLSKIGLVDKNSTLDDVLNLQVADLLSRRLQTIVQRKLYFKTPYQARQAIVHGHIMIGERVVTIPSYTVKIDEEPKIRLTFESQFNQTLSKPESDLGSPETENLEIETESNVDAKKKSEVEKPAKE